MWELNAAHLTLGNPPKASLAPKPAKASVVRTLLGCLAAQVELFLIESFGAIVSRLPKLTQNQSIWVWPSNRSPFFICFLDLGPCGMPRMLLVPSIFIESLSLANCEPEA